jgi:hypothetical protein
VQPSKLQPILHLSFTAARDPLVSRTLCLFLPRDVCAGNQGMAPPLTAPSISPMAPPLAALAPADGNHASSPLHPCRPWLLSNPSAPI